MTMKKPRNRTVFPDPFQPLLSITQPVFLAHKSPKLTCREPIAQRQGPFSPCDFSLKHAERASKVPPFARGNCPLFVHAMQRVFFSLSFYRPSGRNPLVEALLEVYASLSDDVSLGRPRVLPYSIQVDLPEVFPNRNRSSTSRATIARVPCRRSTHLIMVFSRHDPLHGSGDASCL